MVDTGLVYIARVERVASIPDADRIESLTVNCGTAGGTWMGTTLKGDFHEGDTVQVYLQDSIVPQTKELEFMSKCHWRVRMQRLRGTPSECLIMRQSIEGNVGDDITELAGVTRYSKPLPANLAGIVVGQFPSFIPKTDEQNFQKVPELVEALRGQPYRVTTKIDGSSATVFWYNGHFGCCSRKLELKDSETNTIWQIAHHYDLERKLQDRNLAIQFEIAGPGIQKNPLGLLHIEPFLFDVYDIEKHEYVGFDTILTDLPDFPCVETVEQGAAFNYDAEGLRKLAEGVYANGKQREGIVIRPMVEQEVNGDRLSFKACNLLYREG